MKYSSKVVRLAVHPDHIRTFPDPNGLGRKRYFIQVPVDEVHRARVDYGPNPRCQNMETKVAEAIRESLKCSDGWFMYYNKGIVINADAVEYDNKKQLLSLTLRKSNDGDPWDSPNGNLDGGHTNRVILELIDSGLWKNPENEKQRQYVTVEILTGIDEDRLSNLVGARNTNIPVRDLSLAVLGNELDWLLEILDRAGVKNKIAWRQFDDQAEVTGEEVIAYLSILNPEVKEKIRCYTGAGRIVSDLRLRPEHHGKNKVMEGLKTVAPVAVEYLKFVDYIHRRLKNWYESCKKERGENAKFAGLSGVSKGENHLVFLNELIEYRVAKSWLMPLANAFASVIEKEPSAPDTWRELANIVGPQLMDTLVNVTNDERNNLNAIGKKKPLWDMLRAFVEAEYWKRIASKHK